MVDLSNFWDTKTWQALRYFGVNSIFTACIYFGFFHAAPIEGAANLAVFIAWLTGISGAILLLGIAIDSRPSAKGDLLDSLARRKPSVIPYWFDLMFDVCVVAAFIWSGYYWVTLFYIVAGFTTKKLRDFPADQMLKNLKSQQS